MRTRLVVIACVAAALAVGCGGSPPAPAYYGAQYPNERPAAAPAAAPNAAPAPASCGCTVGARP